MRIAMTADHAGFEMKNQLAEWLLADGHEIVDLGTNGPESVDYPRYGAILADALADGRADRGITVCGSGIGVAIAANRNPACRCAQVSEPLSASLARKHNDCNAIAIGARLIGLEMAKACITAFLSSDFLGGRHQRRVDQLANPSEQEPA
jgi:ribose 5-phosphate isomerase B